MSKLVANYKLLDPVGSGQYGKVYKAENIEDKKLYAAKVIQRDMIESNPKMKECIINEINTLSKINSEFVVKFVEMHKTQNNAYLVYEFCDGGTLEKAMFECGYFRESEAMGYFKQLVQGFQAIVEHAIIHRDLKPQNILMKGNNVKIADFGFCKPLKSKSDLTSTVLGSPIYMAPEIMKGEKYGMKSDIWSLGVVFFEILLGICPFEGTSLENMLELISQGSPTFPSRFGLSEGTKSLIRKMLDPNPNSRIDWPEIFSQYGEGYVGGSTPKSYDFDFSGTRALTTIAKAKTPDLSPERLVNLSPSKFTSNFQPPPISAPGFSNLPPPISSTNTNTNTNGFNLRKLSSSSTSQHRTIISGLISKSPLSFLTQTKVSIFESLLHERNKILFGMELAINLLNTSLNQNLLLARNVVSLLLEESQFLLTELSKPLGGVYLSTLTIPRTEIIDSFEFKAILKGISSESDQLSLLLNKVNEDLGFSKGLSTDFTNVANGLKEFASEILRKGSSRNSNLLANQVLDVLLIHEVFDKVLDPKSTYESQGYFSCLKGIGASELAGIVQRKQRVVERVIKA